MGDYGFIIMALLLGMAYVYLLRIHIAYRMALNRHRDPLGWVMLSLFFSPILTWIILLFVGDNTDVHDRDEHLERYERDNTH